MRKRTFLLAVLCIGTSVCFAVNSEKPTSDREAKKVEVDKSAKSKPERWMKQIIWRDKLKKGQSLQKAQGALGKPKYIQKSSGKARLYYQAIPKITIDSKTGEKKMVEPKCGFVELSTPWTREYANQLHIAILNPKQHSKKILRPKYFVTGWVEPDWNISNKTTDKPNTEEKELVPKRKLEKWEDKKIWQKLAVNLDERNIVKLFGEPTTKHKGVKSVGNQSGVAPERSGELDNTQGDPFDVYRQTPSDGHWYRYGPEDIGGVFHFYYDEKIHRHRLENWVEPFWLVLEKSLYKKASKAQELLKNKQLDLSRLPPHKFHLGSKQNLRRNRSQLRAIVSLGAYNEKELRCLAVELAKQYYPDSAATLVQFFDDDSCLDDWDGTGLLSDEDWPHWLCRIAIDTNTSGELYDRTFELALDEKTGQNRNDVLR